MPPPGLLDALASLCDDPRNIVYIISGRNGDFLQQHLGHIEKLGMSAEHGCFLREPGAHEWTDLTEDYDMGWMDDVEEIFKCGCPDRHGGFALSADTLAQKTTRRGH